MNPLLLESLNASSSPSNKGEQIELAKKIPKIILVFDTETSGLLPNKTDELILDKYPFILQLSFVLYDMEQRRTLRKYNKYIKVQEYVEISPFITNLTGITKEICMSGVDITIALLEFYSAYKLCDAIVGHNISFDCKMLELEIIRNYNILSKTNPTIALIFNSTFQRLENKRMYCTMSMGRNICNIMVASKTNPQNFYKKNPKLEELYSKLFLEKIPNAHDALFDTMACLRCFVKIMSDVDI